MPGALIVFLHSDADRSAAYQYAVARLNSAGHVVVAPEEHGHDHSEAYQGRRLKAAVAELDAFVSAENAEHGLPVVIFGNGAGSSIALSYAVAHQDRLAGLMLTAPLAQPAASPLRQWFHGLGSTLLPDAPAPPEAGLSSADPIVDTDYFADPLTHLGAGSRISSSAEAARRADRILDGVETLTLATLLVWGTREGLTPAGGAEHLLGKLEHADLTRQSFDVLYHDVLSGPEREAVLDVMLAWLEQLTG